MIVSDSALHLYRWSGSIDPSRTWRRNLRHTQTSDHQRSVSQAAEATGTFRQHSAELRKSQRSRDSGAPPLERKTWDRRSGHHKVTRARNGSYEGCRCATVQLPSL